MLSHPEFISPRVEQKLGRPETQVWETEEEVNDRCGRKWRKIFEIIECCLWDDKPPYLKLNENGRTLDVPRKHEMKIKRDPKAVHKLVLYCEFTQYVEWIMKVSS